MTAEMFVGETTNDRVRTLGLMPGENIVEFEHYFKKIKWMNCWTQIKRLSF